MHSPSRIGVFGGTFDPIHKTHLDIGRAAVEQVSLDRLYFVVAGNPPHKRNATFASAEDRYAMVQAALAGMDRMVASRIEMDRQGPSFTADTLARFKQDHPGSELFLILGMDALIDLPRWRAPGRILDLAKLLVVPRPGTWTVPPAMKGLYAELDFEEAEDSSTEVRRRILAGESLEPLVPEPVRKLIEARGIYRSCALDLTGKDGHA